MTLKAAFEQIERQTSYTVAYTESKIDTNATVDVDLRNATIQEAMTALLRNAGCTYTLEGRHIVITARAATTPAATAKQFAVTGFCFAESDGKALVGVAVIVRGSNRGTTTDSNGRFRIMASPTDVLQFNYLGYDSKEVTVNAQSVLSVSMQDAALKIDNVVVTALGMKREEKSLGYAVTTVKADDLVNASGHNWIDGLAGKVAGLTMQHASAGPGGSTRVVLRGESSFNMSNNEALFVVDGVPIQNSMTAGGGSAYDGKEMPIDYGNAVADIAPENIESVTVLKGASATALYGARAGNGAIVITTKGGSTAKGIGVSVKYDLAFEHVGHMPDFQYEYGGGSSSTSQNYYAFRKDASLGTTVSNTPWAFGPRFDANRNFYQYEGWNFDDPSKSIATPWVPRKNWYKGFFETGITHSENVTISGGNGKGLNMRVSLSARQNDWIVPNTGYESQNISINTGYQINKKLRLDLRMTYYRRTSDNLPTVGYGQSSPTYALLWSSNHQDINWMEQVWKPGQEYIQQNNELNSNWDNPYFIVNEQLNTLNRNRVYGNVSATYDIIEGLSLQARLGMDNNQEFRSFRKPWSSIQYKTGYYREQDVTNYEINADFLLKYDKTFGDFGLAVSLGGNSMHQNYRTISMTVQDLRRPDLFNLRNTSSGIITFPSGPREKEVNSFYGLAQFSWKNALFLDVTGRNDWSSTLPINNNSYFFPSVSASAVLNELIDFSRVYDVLSFVKLRASWARVGIDTSPYKLDMYFSNTSWDTSVTVPTLLPPDGLKPEMVESMEFGADIRLFKNRLGFDVNYYNSKSYNLILDMPIAESTGYMKKVSNVGKIVNRGWEVAANFSVIRNKNWNWRMTGTWSRNVNRVEELAEGIDSWIISQGPSGAGRIEGRLGGSLGDLYGNMLVKAPEGSMVVNADGSMSDCSGQIIYQDGYPSVTTTADHALGNTQPKWKGGFSNSLKYKNLTFNFTFEGQYGGQVYSLSHAVLAYSGKLTNSLEGRYDGLVGQGVMLNAEGQYVKNTAVADDLQRYYGLLYRRENTENNTFDTSFIKLREVRLEYSLPKKWLTKTRVLQNVTLAVYGTNLFTITNFPMFDPEINTLNGAEIQAGFELGQLPGTRSFGFSIAATF